MGELVPRGWLSSMGARTGTIKFVIAGTQDWWCRFPHCWVADSIWLECAESLITKRKLLRRLI